MALIKSVRGFTPVFGKNVFLAENSTIIGDTVTGNDCSIWFNTVIRGDVNSIRIGNRVNIQDGAILHCHFKTSVIEIGDDVSVGHNAVIHGAIIKERVLVGMGAIILDNAVIGENSIIAAGALVLSGTIVEPDSLWGGVPAKFIRKIDPSEGRDKNLKTAANYLMYAGWYREDS